MRVLLLLLLATLAHAQPALRGFPADRLPDHLAREQRLRATPDPLRIRSYFNRMAEVPHHAGSPASRAVADYALGLFRQWGLDARIETFEALLPYPTERVVELVTPTRFRARLQEPPLPDDPDSSDRNQLPTYNAFSAAGDVTAPLVYANYGLPEDYEILKSQGVDVRGKIVLTRYGKSWRGVKPKVAQENGAVGCLIYSDPRDDGYFVGETYPRGPYRPADSVQRGSVMDMAIHPGDPLSPGWASEPGARRLALAEARTLMRIPVLPISHADAQPLLAALGGPVAPEAWRGALPVTYHLGPGTATVRLKLDFDWSTRPLHNVIATIPGSEFPDQWVLFGNHHDAWVNGANDPVSGAAALLETARTLAEEVKRGWRPRRTIVLALWDGEEFGLLGSTEWVEKHAAELSTKAVAYLNSDSNGRGSFSASGSSALGTFVSEILRDVPHPTSQKPLLEAARARRGEAADAEQGFRLGPLGSGSDYVAFTHHLGIASLNMGFAGAESGGVYHSIYDSIAWYTRFSDGDFLHGRALAQVTSTMLARLSDSTLLPFEFSGFQRAVSGYVQEIRRQAADRADALGLAALGVELARMEALSQDFDRLGTQALARSLPREQAAPLNQRIYRTERMLTLPEGLPGREWYRHQISAPGLYTGYGAKTLPGIREAVEAGRWEEAARQTQAVLRALRAFNGHLAETNRLLAEATPGAAPARTP